MKEKEVSVSVIMGVYNQWDEQILQKAVESILNQSFKDFEFIIYDDGSQPHAALMLEKIKQLDPRIVLIGQRENHGLAFSLNSCIEHAKGRYIARMDADDISDPGRLQEQYDFMEAHPEYSWCGCNAKLLDDNGIWGMATRPERPTENDYLKFSPYIHPTVMYRASLFEETEGYKVSKETLLCEDYELFMRLRQLGKKGYNIQKTLFTYREDANSYKRRDLNRSINEAKVRYVNFKKMHILFPKGWIYVIRPIAACMIPRDLLYKVKRKKSWKKEIKTELIITGK